MELTLEQKVDLFTSYLHERKAENVIAIDVREKCSFTEYLLICTGTATLHNKAIADYILDKCSEHKIKVLGKEGFDACTWILLDLNDIIIHIFLEATLAMYQLEDLWKTKTIIKDK
jgi:ribosome-associated protein